MNILVLTSPGAENVAAGEIKEIIGKDAEVNASCVLVKGSKKELERLSYSMQSAEKVLEVLIFCTFKNETFFDEVNKSIDAANLNFKGSFALRAVHTKNIPFTSSEIELTIGGHLQERSGAKVDLENPDTLVNIFVHEDQAYVGIDHAKRILSKRDYKIFSNRQSLRGTVAYTILKSVGFKSGKTLVDPFIKSGEIIIEAALYARGRSPHYYTKDNFGFECDSFDEEKENKGKIVGFDKQLANIKASQKNAKIAGVEKEIGFSRVDVEWLDTKFEEKTVDGIATYITPNTKNPQAKTSTAEIKEVFHQASFILKKKGRLGILVHKKDILKEYHKKYDLKKVIDQKLWQGKECFDLVVFEKEK